MRTIVKSGCLATVLLAFGACSKVGSGQDEMTWARGALERNTHLEVVAADEQAKTFTVRLKDSGQLIVVAVDQVIAGPEAALSVPAKQTAAAPGTPEAPAESPMAPAPA